MLGNDEKKVEYIELIYDLIFVYLIGKNAALLSSVEAGFIRWKTFGDYLFGSLIVLQIWTDSTLFMNRFGKNSVPDKVMLLINMLLLYVMGANMIRGREVHYAAYMGAWALILVNLAVWYLFELRASEDPRMKRHIRMTVARLLLQAAVIGVSIPVYLRTGFAFGPWAVWIGIAAEPFLERIPTNFGHLTERVMLYVVFTFGDMILVLAEYFSDGFSLPTLYFALVSFLIVAGLFFSYGYLYDRLLDRSGECSGSGYMLLHVFMILGLSCVTTSLEFMRDAAVSSTPKTLMLVMSFLAFYLSLALTEKWSFRQYRMRGRFLLLLAGEFLLFAAAMMLSAGKDGYGTSAIALTFVYVQLGTLMLSSKNTRLRDGAGK